MTSILKTLFISRLTYRVRGVVAMQEASGMLCVMFPLIVSVVFVLFALSNRNSLSRKVGGR